MLTIETKVSHTPLARRSVITVTLDGGDLPEREAAVGAILSRIRPPEAAAKPGPPTLATVFSLLSTPADAPAPPREPTRPVRQEAVADYEDVFVLAPLE